MSEKQTQGLPDPSTAQRPHLSRSWPGGGCPKPADRECRQGPQRAFLTFVARLTHRPADRGHRVIPRGVDASIQTFLLRVQAERYGARLLETNGFREGAIVFKI